MRATSWEHGRAPEYGKKRIYLASACAMLSLPLARKLRDPDSWQRRAFRTVSAAYAAGIDYRETCQRIGVVQEERKGKRSGQTWCKEMLEMHARQADRLLQLSRANGGLYAKMAQFIAARSNVGLPEVYGRSLKQMQDRADPKPFSTIRKVLEEDFGKEVMDDAFNYIEEAPIAAASIAQVHRARLKDGTRVALKVQYPQIKKQFLADLMLLDVINSIAHLFLPKLDFSWLLKDMRESCNQELDFKREQRNACKLSDLAKGIRGIHVPKVLDGLSSKRVIVMEYVDGWRVDDQAAMRSNKVNQRAVAELLAIAYGQMMFQGGMVHCDPHAGNLLVRKDHNGTPELVFLDHGLYIEMPTKLRIDYATLWVALQKKDKNELEQVAHSLGVPLDLVRFHPLLFEGDPPAQHRAWQTIPSHQRKDMERWVNARMDGRGQLAQDAMRFLTSLPKEIIYLHRAQAIVASLTRELVGRGKNEDSRLCIYFKHATAAVK